VSVTTTSLVHVPAEAEDTGGSAQVVWREVTVEGGKVDTVVVVDDEMELDTNSDEPNSVDVGIGMQAILDAVRRMNECDGE
jgi:hypothetical protein